LWGPLEEGTSTTTSSPPPKSIRKKQERSSSKKEHLQVRFSDEIYYDDDSSSSLDARYPAWDDEDGRGGGKIVKPKGMIGGLSSSELKRGVWFEACLKEFWVRESEAVFGVRRWRLFGTRVQ
jgi:hypothetical protein